MHDFILFAIGFLAGVVITFSALATHTNTLLTCLHERMDSIVGVTTRTLEIITEEDDG